MSRANPLMNNEIAKVVSISVRLKEIAISRATPEGEDEAKVALRTKSEERAVLWQMGQMRGESSTAVIRDIQVPPICSRPCLGRVWIRKEMRDERCRGGLELDANILSGFLCRSGPKRPGRDCHFHFLLSRLFDSSEILHGVKRPRLRVRVRFLLFLRG